MDKSITQNYSYATDEKGILVHVNDAVRGQLYKCPYCSGQMTPHMGKIRKWHFTHKANLDNCSYESYLHKIAKICIKNAFISSSNFNISYDVPVRCNLNCSIMNHSNCYDTQIMQFNLKEYYDTCQEEVKYKNFIADLILSSSTKEIDPILIEIYVSHKSTEEKLTEGVRIIEIEIKSEEDIDDICLNRMIYGERISKFRYLKGERPKNIFYNFKREYLVPPSSFSQKRPYKHILWVKDSGEFQSKQCLCSTPIGNLIPKDAHYIIANLSIDFAWAFIELYKRGVEVKNCLICKYLKRTIFNERVCTLYKKFNLPKCPSTKYAKECEYFRRLQSVSNPYTHYELDGVSMFKYDIVVRKK
ncbi:MAG: hypothetical protein IJ352_09030 [Muribaculaceae bacterium]|nr:hypothetical protein [Muribaculaceae bacterium]